MEKSIDERLFEQIMRAPHAVRRLVMNGRFEEGEDFPERPPFPPMGEHGKMHGHGPHGPFGPCGGPDRGLGHCGSDRGPGHCGRPEMGPGHHGGRHGKGRAFVRERLLGVIGSYENGVKQKELVEELHINPSSVSELIVKLEDDGYVKRIVDPDDKRSTLISRTELGAARAAELSDERAAMFAGVFSNLTDVEKEQLLALLEKLTACE